jgi:hypothetical protein
VPGQARKIDNARLYRQNLYHTCPTDSQLFIAGISEVCASFKDGVSEILNSHYGFPRKKKALAACSQNVNKFPKFWGTFIKTGRF